MGKCDGRPRPASWKDIAISLQQNLMKHFGKTDWNSYSPTRREELEAEVGYALFGPPSYDAKQTEHIRHVCSMIVQEDIHCLQSGDTWMTILFVCMELQVSEGQELCIATTPVFKVPRYEKGLSDSVRFIDSNGRVYKNWQDYLQNNQIPNYNICYPKDGSYRADSHGNVVVEFGGTPSSSEKQRILLTLDKTTSTVALGCSFVTLVSLLHSVSDNILSLTAWTSSIIGAYGAARSALTLMDRYKHKQTLSPINLEARNCWLSVGGTVIGFASARAMNSFQTAVRYRQYTTKFQQYTVTTLATSSLAISAAGLVNNGSMLYQKRKEEKLTPLELYQIATSAIFFVHSVMNTKTAGTIIEETQSNFAKFHRGDAPWERHHRKFRFGKGAWQGREVTGQEKRPGCDRFMKRFMNKDSTSMSKFMDNDSGFWRTEKNIKFTETGNVEINQKLIIDPKKFFEISSHQQKVFIDASKGMSEGKLSPRQFKDIMKSINLEESNPMYHNRHDAPCMFKGKHPKDFDWGNQRPDSNAIEHNMDMRKFFGMRKLWTKEDVFSGMKIANKDFPQPQSEVSLNEAGLLEISQKFTIDPMEFFNLNNDEHKLFMKASQEMYEGKLNHKHFEKMMKNFHHRRHFGGKSRQIKNTVETKEKLIESSSKTKQRNLLMTAALYAPANIYVIMKNFDKSLHQRLFEAAMKVSDLMGWTPARTFLDILGLVCNYVQDVASQMEMKYQEDLEAAKAKDEEYFNQEQFDRNYKIRGKRFSHFCSIVLESFTSDPALLERLMTDVEEGVNIYSNWRGSDVEEEEETTETEEEVEETNERDILMNHGRGRWFHRFGDHRHLSDNGFSDGPMRMNFLKEVAKRSVS